MSSSCPQGHIAVAVVGAWGHARPLCAFASRVAATRSVNVTFITTTRIYDRVQTEISRGFGPQNADRADLGPPGPTHTENMRIELERYFVSFASAYEQLANRKPVKCVATDAELPAVPAPKILVLDFMLGNLIKIAQGIDKGHAKAIAFLSGMVSFLYPSFAPVERGGRADFQIKAQAEAERSGRPVAEVADEMFHNFTRDELIRAPGLPTMHRWELDPQDTAFMTKGLIGQMWLTVQGTFDTCDGLILTTSEVYEPKAVEAIKEWYAESSRPVWTIGPLLPPTTAAHAIEGEGSLSGNTMEIKDFMEGVLKSHGEHSMLYISFGSSFWPSETEKIETFINVLIERKIPFIFSLGSPLAKISDELRTQVNASGLGLLSPWSPQQTILAHPVLGWFVSHCGHNSTIEALSAGVPLICWPFHADQAVNAVNITENHDAGYELLEVRTGNGLKPIYRTGKAPVNTLDALRAETNEVLEKAFGSDGAKKRANAKRLQVEMAGAWATGGVAEKEMERLLDSLGA